MNLNEFCLLKFLQVPDELADMNDIMGQLLIGFNDKNE